MVFRFNVLDSLFQHLLLKLLLNLGYCTLVSWCYSDLMHGNKFFPKSEINSPIYEQNLVATTVSSSFSLVEHSHYSNSDKMNFAWSLLFFDHRSSMKHLNLLLPTQAIIKLLKKKCKQHMNKAAELVLNSDQEQVFEHFRLQLLWFFQGQMLLFSGTMPMLLWFRWFWTSRKKLLQKLFKNMFKTCYFIDIVTSVTPGQMTQTWLTQLLDFTTFQNRRNKSGHFMLWMTNMNCPDLFLRCWKVVKSSSWVGHDCVNLSRSDGSNNSCHLSKK